MERSQFRRKPMQKIAFRRIDAARRPRPSLYGAVPGLRNDGALPTEYKTKPIPSQGVGAIRLGPLMGSGSGGRTGWGFEGVSVRGVVSKTGKSWVMTIARGCRMIVVR